MKINVKKLLPILILCFFGVIFHYQHFNDFPSHTHSWAQSDRFAISKSFVNNELNLLEPETFLLNPQFPDFWETPQKESITSVDFPIHDFIPAIFMKITGIDSPWVVRLYNLLYSILGLLFLYKLALFYLNNQLKALFIAIFAATSPVFLFYQNSFIPSIPSLANAIISLYFFAQYSRENKNKKFNLAILFGTLAALSRTTFLIPLIAILGTEFLQIIRKKSALLPKIIPVLIAITIFVGYYFYNKYLRSLYGSSFLDTLMNADDLDAFFTKLKTSIQNWGMQYFSSIHYYLVLVLLISALFFYFFKRQKTSVELKKIHVFIAILLLGNLLFLIAMVHQFILHDYYFLDSFYLPFVLLLIPILATIPNPNSQWTTISASTLLVIFSLLLIQNGVDSQKERYTYQFWEEGEFVVENYQIADKALHSLGYDDQAKILIFESFAPNLPLLVLNRKGFAVMANRTSTIDKALTWNYDAIVFQNEQFVSKVLPIYPNILNKMTKIWGNDKITICKPKENNLSFTSFFELDKKEIVLQSSLKWNETNPHNWDNIEYEIKDSIFAIVMKNESGPVFSKHTSNFFKSEKTLIFEGEFKLPKDHNASITISISNEKGKNHYYKVKDLKNLVPENGKWNEVKLWLNIPVIEEEKLELKLYLTNSSKTEIQMTNLAVKMIETEI